MAIISESKIGETPFQKLIGHNKHLMEAWAGLGSVLEKEGLLTAKLKEQVRRTLAQKNGCEYCKAKGKPKAETFDEKTSIAVGFSEVFLSYPNGNIPDYAFNILKEQFSEPEISELCAFICFTIAQQYFGAMMKLLPE
ncbi:carboxymuconolactone decarboxylase family protein [Bacillus luteolus]|uniref:Carboxymuconolactone decarboxylase family protein n=1 Tax=Litchfieldia luteola TaxID=682179 RepID=A0ABR9QGL7_9BACI|nr:carboxymuconolactone decarboxylase family protein [Cytobacillus luteolus]MBE4907635.1 carboxymuconolactone decarboxylase family protein [Cytobacillus luteolus]MBP1941086.1 alkylhydroperoxidase family enzyme [Cytobacillus luteolus]